MGGGLNQRDSLFERPWLFFPPDRMNRLTRNPPKPPLRSRHAAAWRGLDHFLRNLACRWISL